MADQIHVLSSIELDGEPIECRHGVLIHAGEWPSDDWVVILHDVAPSSRTLIHIRQETKLETRDGIVVEGEVYCDPADRAADFTKLIGGEAAQRMARAKAA